MSKASELLEDLEFIKWVKYPNRDLDVFWRKWMDANPDRIKDVMLARELILGLQFPSKLPSGELREEVFANLLRENERSDIIEFSRKTSSSEHSWFHKWQFAKIAAVLVLGVLFAFLFEMFNAHNSDDKVKETTKWLTKSINEGEKLSFKLPDQTIVWLNSGSSLRYPESFDSTVRLVELKGEGFFEVSENAEKPFQVLSDDLLTTALGTSFNINNNIPGKVKVALVTGKVSVQPQNDSLAYFLRPGFALDYKKDSHQAKIRSFDHDTELGWKSGKLIFNNSSFHQVIRKLQKWYGVEFEIVGGPGQDWQFKGKFENQTLENVLKSMSNIEDFTYQLNNRNVVLKF
ncbi:FecR family protein [Echinicola shivajiensis]|uniref:FecR family protein n=1 Tax=Echinicola shivajiensis TaxID=1035916 RepID=UPI001BFC9E1C|nr:FecR family protein [Echinicola shivajiensis]